MHSKMTVKEAYNRGFINGLESYVYIKDDIMVCGKNKIPLVYILSCLIDEPNYNPPKEEESK